MFKICFYVPLEFAAQVKQKMFAAGAGRIGYYDQCSWEVEGIGQFRALPGSTPFVGVENKTELVRELRIEMVCERKHLQAALSALKNTHPYETPAYFITEGIEIV